MSKLMEKLELLLKLGGMKEDIKFLVISGATVKMEEKVMIISIIGMIIGAMVAAFGLYYLIKEKHDKESCKIYGIISGIGGIVFAFMLLRLIL